MDHQLIKLVNKLQDTFANLGGELDMPQLVVVGSQSAGKSSVLETIVGRDFLPRGQGIVTRRPLVLQLIHTPAPDPSSSQAYAEWGQFLHVDKRFTDFNEIRKEIEQETYRVAGQNKGISKLPIHLRIYSPDVLDLTLVDLPGLTKIPVGDQPTDIERQIRSLVLDYISKPNCVILSVSAANVDLANSESLKLARAVDPQGRRTIGVLTKLDLMDAGTNALDILTGRIYPLKLGFIGVVNRSQQDINSDKSMKAALESETEFFRNHPAYRNISEKNGTKYLARTLNQVLMNHIRDKLPDMKARLNTLMGQTQQELNSFGDISLFDDPNAQSSLILRLMTQFARDFVASIEGTSIEISTKELSGGARIYYIFNDVFGHALESIDATQNLELADIRTAIRNSLGPKPSLFVPEMAFELLVKPQIKLLEAPSLRCVEMVYEELVRICHNCTSVELQRFPRLHSQLIEVVSELLRERLGPTSEYTRSLIEIQAAYINTNHPSFIAGSINARNGANGASASTARGGVQKPTTEVNGVASHSADDEDEESSSSDDTTSTTNPPANQPPSARSVSATLYDRSTNSSSATLTNALLASSSQTVSRDVRHGRHSVPHNIPSSVNAPHRSSSQLRSVVSAGSGAGGAPPGTSPQSAKETFLNYFFGQNGSGGPPPPGGIAGVGNAGHGHGAHGHGHHASPLGASVGLSSAAVDSVGGGVVPSGRDTAQAGGKPRGSMEGGNAAYDMKSLGKHIEAIPVSNSHLSQREEMETSLIRSLISSYFQIVRQTIQDLVPKAIMHFLVNFTSQHVQNRLVSSLYKSNLFSELLNEDEALVAERSRVKALLEAYKEAFKTLSEVNLKTV